MTINYLRLAGLLSILLFGVVDESHAQTDCDSVLKKDIQINKTTSSERQQASFNYACSHDFQEFNDTYGGSASGQYGVIGGSGAYNQGNYKKFQSDHCAGATSSDHQSGFEYYTLRDASAGVIPAWQACMANPNRRGFNCWAEPESGNVRRESS